MSRQDRNGDTQTYNFWSDSASTQAPVMLSQDNMFQTTSSPGQGYPTLQTTSGPGQGYQTPQTTSGPGQGYPTLQTTSGPGQGYQTPQTTSGPGQGYPTLQTTSGPGQGYQTPQTTSGPGQGYPTLQTTSGPGQGYPPLQTTSRPGQGYPPLQNIGPGQGYPALQTIGPGQGYPALQTTSRPGQGYPPLQTTSRPGQGYPPLQTTSMPGQGYPALLTASFNTAPNCQGLTGTSQSQASNCQGLTGTSQSQAHLPGDQQTTSHDDFEMLPALVDHLLTDSAGYSDRGDHIHPRSDDCNQLFQSIGGQAMSLEVTAERKTEMESRLEENTLGRAGAGRVRNATVEILKSVGSYKQLVQLEGSSDGQGILSAVTQFEKALLLTLKVEDFQFNPRDNIPMKRSKIERHEGGERTGDDPLNQQSRGGHDPGQLHQQSRGGHDPGQLHQQSRGGHDPGQLHQQSRGSHDPGQLNQQTGRGQDPGQLSQQSRGGHDPNPMNQQSCGGHDPGQWNQHYGAGYDATDCIISSQESATAPADADVDEVVLLLIGRSGNGKSATGNSILGAPTFKTRVTSQAGVTKIGQGRREIGGEMVTVIDGPGINFPDKATPEQLKKVTQEVKEALKLSSYGFTALLLPFEFGGRFTQQEIDTLRVIRSVLGVKVIEKYGVCVITRGDDFEYEAEEEKEDGKTLTFEGWVDKQTGNMKELLLECKHRCVLFNNATKDEATKQRQVATLMSVVPRQARYTREEYKEAATGRQALAMVAQLPGLMKEVKDHAETIGQKINQIEQNREDDFETYKIDMKVLLEKLDLLETMLQKGGPKCTEVDGMSLQLRNLKIDITTKIRQRELKTEIMKAKNKKGKFLQRSSTLEH